MLHHYRVPKGAFARATEDDLDKEFSVDGDAGPAIGDCDIATCSRAYRSFRRSDCTYQPYGGPRRLCSIVSPGDAAKVMDDADLAPPRRYSHERAIPPSVRRLLRMFRVH
jgi:hypothetical protein